jgi:hypothetical protein
MTTKTSAAGYPVAPPGGRLSAGSVPRFKQRGESSSLGRPAVTIPPRRAK